LPDSCPHCGGALNADELEWLDTQRAECTYCGMVVQTE
jgi:hypothetical protein